MGGGGPEMMGYDAMGMPVENEKNYLPITYFVRASWRLVTLADAMPVSRSNLITIKKNMKIVRNSFVPMESSSTKNQKMHRL